MWISFILVDAHSIFLCCRATRCHAIDILYHCCTAAGQISKSLLEFTISYYSRILSLHRTIKVEVEKQVFGINRKFDYSRLFTNLIQDTCNKDCTGPHGHVFWICPHKKSSEIPQNILRVIHAACPVMLRFVHTKKCSLRKIMEHPVRPVIRSSVHHLTGRPSTTTTIRSRSALRARRRTIAAVTPPPPPPLPPTTW